MSDFKNILFPVDFSSQSDVVARDVGLFAEFFDAALLLLHAVPLPVTLEPYTFDPQQLSLEARLNKFANEHFSGRKVQTFVSLGDPAFEIVEHAKNKKADLIMMPTHGRGSFRRFLLGSVTAKVLHDTDCPVWTFAHIEDGHPLPPLNVKQLLCAVDLDDIGEHTLRYAGKLARRLGARLTIAHAVPSVETWPTQFNREFEQDLIGAARAKLAGMQAAAGVPGELCVGAGDIARFVAHSAKLHEAGIVVIGRGGHSPLGRLATHDFGIVRECECPVLSI